MKDSDFTAEDNSESRWNSNLEYNESKKTPPSGSNVQAKDLLSSHLKENITFPKVEYEKFIANFPDPLYYFAQNKKTSQFIDEEDVKSMVNVWEIRTKQLSKAFSYTLVFNVFFMRALNGYNKIFGLTHRRSVPGILIKYYIIPNAVRQTLDSLFFYPSYRQASQQIQSKYNFQDPLFMTEYEHDPNPMEAIHSYLRSRATKSAEVSPNPNITNGVNDLKK